MHPAGIPDVTHTGGGWQGKGPEVDARRIPSRRLRSGELRSARPPQAIQHVEQREADLVHLRHRLARASSTQDREDAEVGGRVSVGSGVKGGRYQGGRAPNQQTHHRGPPPPPPCLPCCALPVGKLLPKVKLHTSLRACVCVRVCFVLCHSCLTGCGRQGVIQARRRPWQEGASCCITTGGHSNVVVLTISFFYIYCVITYQYIPYLNIYL